MAAPSTTHPWKETRLWKTLADRTAEGGNAHVKSICHTVEAWMDKMVPVLAAGGTSPNDFTLHDAEHSLRVAERIADLVPDIVNLSDYEVGLLLLASFGHDIGMTPQRGKVRNHHGHLFGNKTGLTETEKSEFQRFLDEYSAGPVKTPLTSSQSGLDHAEEVIAYFVRDRHNEWSAEWIRENLDPKAFGSLPDPVGKLVLLCCSHHYGFDALRGSNFDPIPSGGSAPQIVHLRYLACLLRLADILENDPARTPPVLFEHREIASREKSLNHWKLPGCFDIQIREGQLHIHSRPTDAHLHKAVLDLTAAINYELNGITSLGHAMPLEFQVGKDKIRRDWHLAPALSEDIQSDGSYEYLDGAFRPNTARLLQLLSNEQLYGNPFAAVRELLQNAFDAVREKIARQHLLAHERGTPDADWEKNLGNHQHVTLTLRPGATGGWELICEDSGVGMDIAIIKNHVLVSGNSRRHSIMDLERRCEEKGFRLGRTGQFGIGVLSYFMLADEVSIETTRARICGGSEKSLAFQTRGVGSFGELRKFDSDFFPDSGSRVIWKIRPHRIDDPRKFGEELLAYLKETLIRIPCNFTYKTANLPGGTSGWIRPTGWVKTEENWLELAKSNWEHPIHSSDYTADFLPADKLSARITKLEMVHADLAEARSTLRCATLEFKLPGNSGNGRLILLFFEKLKGHSLVSNPGSQSDIRITPSHPFITSWKGIFCPISELYSAYSEELDTDDAGFTPSCVAMELDFESCDESEIGVSRNEFRPKDQRLDSLRSDIQMISSGWIEGILSGGSGSYYSSLNDSELELHPRFDDGDGWFFGDRYNKSFEPLSLPIVIAECENLIFSKCWDAEGNAMQVSDYIYSRRNNLWKPSEVRLFRNAGRSRARFGFVFEKLEGNAKTRRTRFPGTWRDVFMVSHDFGGSALNPDHRISSLFTDDQRENIAHDQALFFTRLVETIETSTTASAAAFALVRLAQHFAKGSDREMILAYRQHHKAKLEELWDRVESALPTSEEGTQIIVACGRSQAVFSRNKLATFDLDWDSESLLPLVDDPDFLLYEVDPNSTQSEEE